MTDSDKLNEHVFFKEFFNSEQLGPARSATVPTVHASAAAPRASVAALPALPAPFSGCRPSVWPRGPGSPRP